MNNVNLYKILEIYETEISKHVKHKKRLEKFERHKMSNVIEIYHKLNDIHYQITHYNIFLIKEPKERVIMSLNIKDKVINHYFTRYCLVPKLEKYLDMRNVATRKGMGSDYGIKLLKKYIEQCKKYQNFYVLKLDISKYFYHISHEVLLSLVKKDLNSFEYQFLKNILDSTNQPYVSKTIFSLGSDLPNYQYGKGLPIGNLTSQFLSVFYLNPLDHYIVHDLHLKYYVRYMDDFIILHPDKNYLEECLFKIEEKLESVFKLKVNPKKKEL